MGRMYALAGDDDGAPGALRHTACALKTTHKPLAWNGNGNGNDNQRLRLVESSGAALPLAVGFVLASSGRKQTGFCMHGHPTPSSPDLFTHGEIAKRKLVG